MEATSSMFVAADYVVLIGMVAISVGIGLYYALRDRKNNDINNYNFGGKKMSPIPVGFSAAVSFISAVTVIGFPTDLYYFGTICSWYTVQTILATVISCIYYIPLLYRLQISSIFQYLELRFHKRNRMLSSISEIIKTVFYMGTAVYLPALALNAVVPIRIDVSIALVSVFCTIYTALGGLKAVIWTDTLQSLIMLTGLLATSIRLIILVGGFGNIYSALERGGRLNTFFNDFDPTVQRTFFSLVIGQSIGGFTYITFSQTTMQRYLSCKNISKARQASIFANVPYFIFMGLGLFTGAGMYAYFEGCDPVESGQVTKKDQLMSLTVGKIFNFLPGMNGVFVSSVFGASLSTVSSGINSIALLIVEDFISPFHSNIGSKKKLLLCKTIGVIIGILVAATGIFINQMGSTVVAILTSIYGASGGPSTAVFFLATFFPWCNSIGAFVGQIVGTLVGFWAIFSANYYGVPPDKLLQLPTSVDKCDPSIFNLTSLFQVNYTEMNFTTALTEIAATPTGFKELTFPIWGMSFAYIVILGFLTSFFVAILVSFCTGANEPCSTNPDYFLPMFDNHRLPLRVRKFFRFGVPEKSNEKPKIDMDNEEETMMVAENLRI